VDKQVNVAARAGQAVSQKTEKYERIPIENLGTLKSGDMAEIELVIESKNDYEYIVIEDMKAAGFEPVEVRSGYNGNALGAYMELRDERVCFFVQQLARGKHSVSYRMRAETPGQFSACPPASRPCTPRNSRATRTRSRSRSRIELQQVVHSEGFRRSPTGSPERMWDSEK
jgi:uncharacterized protein YfaS (alpha-2-macroglobulin family)